MEPEAATTLANEAERQTVALLRICAVMEAIAESLQNLVEQGERRLSGDSSWLAREEDEEDGSLDD